MLSSVEVAGREERKRDVWNKTFGEPVAPIFVYGYLQQ
jgi:hypothetical protein